MNWDALGAIADIVAAVGVIASLVYLAVQVRGNTRVVSAQSRHSLSEFALQLSIFRAENADRLARIASERNLSDGDVEFQYWSHMQLLLHAETYFHHHALGLMPDAHWHGYARFMMAYMTSPGFSDVWTKVGFGFSEDFANWVDTELERISSEKRAS